MGGNAPPEVPLAVVRASGARRRGRLGVPRPESGEGHWKEPGSDSRRADRARTRRRGQARGRARLAVWCGRRSRSLDVPPFLRPSELLALERGDVDGDVLHIRRTLDGEGGTKASGKTRRSLRTVPLPVRAREALSGLPPRLDTRLLFPGPSGKPYDLRNFRRREFEPARDSAGLAEDVTPYTLRHSGISWALAAGVPPSDVARFGGTSVTMLERVYAHLLESSAEAARQRLDAFSERLGQGQAAGEGQSQA